jgi:hypothetical protein
MSLPHCNSGTPTLSKAQAQAEGDHAPGFRVKLGMCTERLIFPQCPTCQAVTAVFESAHGLSIVVDAQVPGIGASSNGTCWCGIHGHQVHLVSPRREFPVCLGAGRTACAPPKAPTASRSTPQAMCWRLACPCHRIAALDTTALRHVSHPCHRSCHHLSGYAPHLMSNTLPRKTPTFPVTSGPNTLARAPPRSTAGLVLPKPRNSTFCCWVSSSNAYAMVQAGLQIDICDANDHCLQQTP